MPRKTIWFALALVALCLASSLPAAAQSPQGQAAPSAEVTERARKIAAALEKIGLHPKVVPLPQAIEGHRIDVIIGEQKLGATYTQMLIHVGAENKVGQIYRSALTAPSASRQVDSIKPGPSWIGFISSPRKTVFHSGERLPPGSAFLVPTGYVFANATKPGVAITVIVKRFDNQGVDASKSLPRDLTMEQTARSLYLAAAIKPQVENWMKVLAQAIDDVDRPGAPVATAKPPEPKPPQPKPQAAKPPEPKPQAAKPPEPKPPQPKPEPAKPPASVAIPLRTPERPTAQELFRPPAKPSLSERLQNWWTQKEDRAAADPARWRGRAMTHGGGVIAALGFFSGVPGWVAVGVAFAAGGISAYHSGKPPTPPYEHPAVREAREKLQQYQEKWKQGFSTAELEELGIFTQQLSTMTPAERAQAYRDADIEFTSRVEAFRQMREAEARERAGR